MSLLCSQIAGIAITIVFVGILDVVLAFIVKACFKGSLRVSGRKGQPRASTLQPTANPRTLHTSAWTEALPASIGRS